MQQIIQSLSTIRTYKRKDLVPRAIGSLFAKDHRYDNATKNSKRFFCIDYVEFFQRLQVTPSEHRIFYEYIDGENRKPYFDLEYEYSEKDSEAAIYNFNQILSFVLFGIKTELESKGVDYKQERDCIILSSHGPGKRSVHIIIHKFYFEKCNIMESSNMKYFAEAVRNYVPKQLWTFINPKTNNPSSTVDLSVYSAGREFRLIWNTKLNGNRFLDIDPCTGLEARFPKNPADPDVLPNNVQQLRLFEACMITMTSNCTLLPNWVPEDILNNKIPKHIIDINDDQKQLMIDAFNASEFSDIYRIKDKQSTSSNALYLTAIKFPLFCPIHQRTHDSNNAKLCYSVNGNIYIKCHADGNNDRCYIGKDYDIDNNIEEDEKEASDGDDIGWKCGGIDLRTGQLINNNNTDTNNINNFSDFLPQRVRATPIINNNLQQLNQTHQFIMASPLGWTKNVNNDPIVNIKSTEMSILTMKPGEINVPNDTTSIVTFLDGNIKYIGGCDYTIQDLYSAYEKYRSGKGNKYPIEGGVFGRMLTSLGHTINRKRINGVRTQVVTLKSTNMPVVTTNPIEMLNNIKNPQQAVQNDKPRELNKDVDIRNFIDEYLVQDSEGTIDPDNMYLCFHEYCHKNNIDKKHFKRGRLIQYFNTYMVRDTDRYIIKGWRCKVDKLAANNREKEASYRRIWKWNTAPYEIGWHNGPGRYSKKHLPEWQNINIVHANEEMLKSLADIITESGLTPEAWCIANRSTFGTGKTAILHPYILADPNMKILIVLPRISLTNEYIELYRGLGFEIYTDSDGAQITGNRVIVCYPSLPRVIGEFNLLILDEYKVIKDLQHTIVRTKNNKERACYQALKQRIQNTPKVYVADALLTNAHVLEISRMRQGSMTVYQNFFKKHVGKKVFTVENKELFTCMVIRFLREGKRVSVPTNSKAFAEFLGKHVRDNVPNISVLITTSDNKATVPVQELWRGISCMVFTPTILAGNSYTDPIDVVCGYFTTMSCDQADAMQMLMRCRNNTSKEYYVCIDRKITKKTIPDNIPATTSAIKEYLLRRDTIARMHNENVPEEYKIPMNLIKFNYMDGTIKANHPYFISYVNFVKQNVVKEREYLFRMLLYMRDCGFQYGGNVYTMTQDKEQIDIIKQERKEFNKERREGLIREISEAPNITTAEHKLLSKNTNKTKNDRHKIKKYKLRQQYKVDNVPGWFIRATNGKYRQHNNITKFAELNGITDQKQRFQLMERIGNEIIKAHETNKGLTDQDIINEYNYDMVEYDRETDMRLIVKLCYHALNILMIIGSEEFVRTVISFPGKSTVDVEPNLVRYLEMHKSDINMILKKDQEKESGKEQEIPDIVGIILQKIRDQNINKIQNADIDQNKEINKDEIKDIWKIGSEITNNAFGIKFTDSGGMVMIKNMWILNRHGLIWPVNFDLNDRTELTELGRGMKAWNDQLITRLLIETPK